MGLGKLSQYALDDAVRFIPTPTPMPIAAATTIVAATTPMTTLAVIVPPTKELMIPPEAAAAAAPADALPAATDPAAFCAALTAMACMTAVVLHGERGSTSAKKAG
jgi:hypothetical protein